MDTHEIGSYREKKSGCTSSLLAIIFLLLLKASGPSITGSLG